MKTLSKRVVVNLPENIYSRVKRMADEEYKSLSGWIRDAVIGQVEERNMLHRKGPKRLKRLIKVSNK